ncbi:hypothetical protein Daus18300_013026 [Diaporthe australafricana]|uniref:UBC core domain-containing protein n=1 Tax=Diaporthe australafricana TaxID=127596 RepID=A0ABR3W0N0_9PEZI
MSLKRFNADIRAVSSRLDDGELPGVVAIERGESDGEVVVTIAHEKLTDLLPIRLLAQNVDDYPEGSNFLLFTASDNVPTSVTSSLEDLRNFMFGTKLLETIATLSTGLDRALRFVDDDNPDSMMIDSQDSHEHADSQGEDSDDDDEYFYDSLDDGEEFGLDPVHINDHSLPRSHLASGTLRRIKSDLRAARDAGCKIGILDGLRLSSGSHIFSLSIRASKLGLSQEALEAWDVEFSDYIILLIRIDGLYPSAEQVVEKACTSFSVDFRFGKGAKYKPSPPQARAAFHTKASRSECTSADVSKNDQGRTFEKVFISNSLEQFMNENFFSLVKLRLRTPAHTWDDANEQLRNISSQVWNDRFASGTKKDQGATSSESKPAKKEKPTRLSKGKGKAKAAAPASTEAQGEPRSPKPIPNFLMRDAVVSPLGQCSIPLVAMQFAIHYFVRCTEYCLRCHQHIGTEFEALKPFVCSDPLCLFQYLAMGFGPSIEHEILTQPYVVDLLVSLCYSSVLNPDPLFDRPASGRKSQYRIREFPSGLRLKVPAPIAIASTSTPAVGNATASGISTTTATNYETSPPATSIKVSVDLRDRVVTVSDKDIDRVTPGTWIMLRDSARNPYHHGLVKYVDRQTGNVEVEFIPNGSTKATGAIEMDLLFYDTEFDDLNDAGKAGAIVTILNSLPSIGLLREYVIKNPHDKLRSYSGISPAAATLLEWIVASNRSCILQVTPVGDSHVQDQSLLESIKTRDQEAVPSMKDCVQFRFAQGAPDKELRFHRALKDLDGQINPQFPTLFAWHGSSLSNCILRYGLDFNQVMNGRAYGNGVYFSQDYYTSLAFVHPGGAVSWPNSALNISGVISLCEIVNAPNNFISTSPHLVVAQVDWIQCRYLFAQRSTGQGFAAPAAASASTTPMDLTPTPTLAQDPARTVCGPNREKLSIPLKAVGTRKQQAPQVGSSSKRAHEAMSSAEVTDEEEVADLEFLFGEDESSPPPAKRPNSARDSSVDTVTARQVMTQRPLTPPQTDFRPGTLDLNSLPRLPLPGWADGRSVKRITGDIKHMQKVQASTPLHELGWYIDFESMENMFQWIVELHSFDPQLPLAKEMKKAGITSVVLEVRFGRDYPYSPPFVRVIRPRFLPFASGGGGHITIGGAICMELLTASGWNPVTTMEAVFVSIRMAMSETERPAHLQTTETSARIFDYGANEALDAYIRFASTHGWQVPNDLRETASQAAQSG